MSVSFLDPETDIMDQFLGPETDIMGERNFMSVTEENSFIKAHAKTFLYE